MDGRLTDEDETVEVGSTPKLFGFKDVGRVDEDYTPEGYDSPEDYLKAARETYEADVDADRTNREEALEDKKFAAGEQWDPVVLAQREGLPCLKINTVPQFTAQLVGDWRTNRAAVKVVPADNGDTDVASIRGDLIRAIELRSKAVRTYDNAFESMVQCGDGAFQISVEYAGEDVFDQEIRIRPIDDCLSVVWDRMSIDPTGADANHCFVDDNYPRSEFERLWPEANIGELGDSLRHDLATSGWCDEDLVKVTAHWRIVQRERLLMMFEDGQIHFVTADNLDRLTEKHGKPLKSRIAPCRYAQMHLITGFQILAGPFEYRLNRLPVVRMTGRVINIGGRRVRHGLIRDMKDPVRLRNFWRSVNAEQLGYTPKAQWIAPESAVEGREDDFRHAHLTRDPLLVYNDDATAPPQRVDPPMIQSALLNEAAINAQDLKDVTGIHDASLGIRSNETSGKAIMARQREGDVASLTYYDNGNAAILEGGDIINQLIPQIYDAPRVIRIVGEDEATKLLKINDPFDPKSPDLAVGNYDVAITTGASYTTRRVEAAEAMMQAVQVWPQLIQVAGDIVAKAQDWPGAEELAVRLRKTIPPELLEGETDEQGQPISQGAQIPPEMQAQVQQGQMMLQQQAAALEEVGKELESVKADKTIEEKKLEIDLFNAQTQRMKVLGDLNAKNRDSREKALESLSDSAGDPSPS